MTRTNTGGRLFCIAEDRPGELPGIRLAIASLVRHCPDARIRLISPIVDAATRSWLDGYAQVELVTERVRGATSWNVKPQVLIDALRDGHDEAVWLDSDVIVAADPSAVLDSLAPETLLVTQEALGGAGRADDGRRAAAWGLPVGRRLPEVLNTCVLRTTPAHLPMLRGWADMVGDATYLAAQATPWEQRPVHLVGDQDVLTALLSSERYAGVPLHVLRRGRDIVQYHGLHGFTVVERLRQLASGAPLFIHSQGIKPWHPVFAENLRGRPLLVAMLASYRDASPYVAEAARYRAELPGDEPWMDPYTPVGRALVRSGFGSTALTGLPLAALFDGLWLVKRLTKRA